MAVGDEDGAAGVEAAGLAAPQVDRVGEEVGAGEHVGVLAGDQELGLIDAGGGGDMLELAREPGGQCAHGAGLEQPGDAAEGGGGVADDAAQDRVTGDGRRAEGEEEAAERGAGLAGDSGAGADLGGGVEAVRPAGDAGGERAGGLEGGGDLLPT